MEDKEKIEEELHAINHHLGVLERAMNERFERIKKIIIDYLSLGSDFAKGSLITALKQV